MKNPPASPASTAAAAERQLTVSSVHLNYLIDSARDMGAQLQAVLDELGLNAALLGDIEQRVPLAVEQRLLDTIRQQLDDPLFGLHMGEKVRPASAGSLGYATMSSRNLGEAIGLMLRYERFQSDVAHCDMQVDDETFSISWTPQDGEVDIHRHRVEATFSGWVNFGRWITRSQHHPLAVSFRHACPVDDTGDYERIFCCPVTFNADVNRITLSASLLDIPLADADPEIHQLMRARIEQLLANYQARGNFLGTVRQAILAALPLCTPTLESLADEMGIKPWTLRRRLSAEGTDFSSLLDQVRQEQVQRYLADPRQSISDIASLLGYSEQSALNRAFKRWFDCTPAAYRQRLLQK